MLSDFTGADRVYIACGYTDLRRGIDGLAAMVQQQFDLDPFTNTLAPIKGSSVLASMTVPSNIRLDWSISRFMTVEPVTTFSSVSDGRGSAVCRSSA